MLLFSILASLITVATAATTSSEDQALGVGLDNSIWIKYTLGTQYWAPLAGPARVIDLVQWPDYSWVAIGTDNSLWLCPSVGFWFQCSSLPNQLPVKSVDLLSDKQTLIGVGMNNQLYTRNGLLGVWTLVPNSGFVVDISVLSNGILLGTGPDKQLYSKQNLNTPWVYIGACCVSRTAGLPDGSILGIGDDNSIYKMQSLGDKWALVPNSAAVVSVAAVSALYRVGVHVGIAPDNTLWGKRQSSPSDAWIKLPGGIKALDFIQPSYNTFVVVGTDYQLYNCNSLYNNAHCSLLPNSGSVRSIAYIDSGKKLAGVGLDNQLYTRSSDLFVPSEWTLVPKSGTVVDITTLGNGVLVGTAPDGQLYTKKTIDSPWEFIGGCCVSRTASIGYEGILGIGTDKQVYQKDTLASSWVLMPNSATVINIVGAYLA
ncbi:hypothetical protein HDU79_009081 [Rhizoclosmatium sp. JEL0117]|nr:hypothetical protein HDU79_009081 [Rhizoclosmatium sp. JEL0117]